jgi:hypothetical protein
MVCHRFGRMIMYQTVVLCTFLVEDRKKWRWVMVVPLLRRVELSRRDTPDLNQVKTWALDTCTPATLCSIAGTSVDPPQSRTHFALFVKTPPPPPTRSNRVALPRVDSTTMIFTCLNFHRKVGWPRGVVQGFVLLAISLFVRLLFA